MNIFNKLKLLFLPKKVGVEIQDDKVIEEKGGARVKKIIKYLVIGLIFSFVTQVGNIVWEEYKAHNPEYIKQQEEKAKSMTSENGTNAYFQETTSEKIKEMEKSIGAIGKDVSSLVKNTQEQKENFNTAKQELIEQGNKNLETTKGEIKTLKEDMNKKIKQNSDKITEQTKIFGDVNQEIVKRIDGISVKIEELEKTSGEQKVTIQSIKDGSLELKNPKGKESKTEEKKDKKTEGKKGNSSSKSGEGKDAIANKEKYKPQVTITFMPSTMEYVEDTKVTPKKEQKKKNDSLDIQLGVAKGILTTGAEAKVASFGGQTEENAPVLIRLLSNMTIANGNYTQVNDCFLLGGARGELATNRAVIRLIKISCIFQDEKGERYVASGNVKGWVYDENSSLGVSGELISREGKIIQTMLPLSLLQAGMDYLTQSSTNVFLDGNNVTSTLGSSISSGLSSGASEPLQKIYDYYTNYLDALSPSISFRAGREISILFKGGEKIKLELYKNQEDYDGIGLQKLIEQNNTDEKEILVGGSDE